MTDNGQTDIQKLRNKAYQGHAGAQYALGMKYEDGYGVEKDYAVAAKWYCMAAVQGPLVDQSLLRALYEISKPHPVAPGSNGKTGHPVSPLEIK